MANELKGYDRVVVLMREYEVPEMEYFQSDAFLFCKGIYLKKYE